MAFVFAIVLPEQRIVLLLSSANASEPNKSNIHTELDPQSPISFFLRQNINQYSDQKDIAIYHVEV
jgi:hypothetical protein